MCSCATFPSSNLTTTINASRTCLPGVRCREGIKGGGVKKIKSSFVAHCPWRDRDILRPLSDEVVAVEPAHVRGPLYARHRGEVVDVRLAGHRRHQRRSMLTNSAATWSSKTAAMSGRSLRSVAISPRNLSRFTRPVAAPRPSRSRLTCHGGAGLNLAHAPARGGVRAALDRRRSSRSPRRKRGGPRAGRWPDADQRHEGASHLPRGARRPGRPRGAPCRSGSRRTGCSRSARW